MLRAVNDLLTAKGLLLTSSTVVDATLIAAPSSTKNTSGQRDPEMHQSKKGQQYYFGMKAHIGVDAESGLVHTSAQHGAGNANDVLGANSLLHGQQVDEALKAPSSQGLAPPHTPGRFTFSAQT